jgi:alpha-ribazole phosphatase
MAGWEQGLSEMVSRTRIYLIRHGEVVGHETPGYNGHADVELTARGVAQYHQLKERLAGAGITACYTSDLTRCVAGARIITAELGVEPVLIRELRELDIGVWEGMTWTEIVERYPAEWKARLADLVNYRVPGGENLKDLADRVIPALRKIVLSHRGANVLVVGHGGINRVIILNAIGAPLSAMFTVEQSYACLNIIDYYEDGKTVVSLMNG